MNDLIKKYLDDKDQEELNKKEKKKIQLLAELCIFEKEYSPDNQWSDDFCHSEQIENQQKYYRKVYPEITDKEYEQLLQYSPSNKSNGLALALSVFGWIINACGIIAGLYFCINLSFKVGLAVLFGSFVLGTIIIGLGEIIKLLTEIKHKKS